MKKILSLALVLGMLLTIVSSVPVSAAAGDAYANLPYYFVDFEDGYNMTNVGTTTIVNGGAGGSGKCLKIDEDASMPYGDYLMVKPGPAVLTGTVPAGGTFKISFWVKFGQIMKTDRAYFTFIIGKKEGGYLLDSTSNHPMVLADATSTDWQKITCEVPVTEQVNIKTIFVRTALGGGIPNQLPDGTDSNPGARTYYFDDMEIAVYPASSAPSSSQLKIATGEFKAGQQVTFSHQFTSSNGVATDASFVRIVNTDTTGNKASLGTYLISDTITVPTTPAGDTISFEVVPRDSAGAVGSTASYDFADVVGFMCDLSLGDIETDGSVTATATMLNKTGTQKNALLIVAVFNSDDVLVDYQVTPINCADGTTNGSYTASITDLTDTQSAEVVKAKAFIWDCGEALSPSLVNTTMKELCADCEALKN